LNFTLAISQNAFVQMSSWPLIIDGHAVRVTERTKAKFRGFSRVREHGGQEDLQFPIGAANLQFVWGSPTFNPALQSTEWFVEGVCPRCREYDLASVDIARFEKKESHQHRVIVGGRLSKPRRRRLERCSFRSKRDLRMADS